MRGNQQSTERSRCDARAGAHGCDRPSVGELAFSCLRQVVPDSHDRSAFRESRSFKRCSWRKDGDLKGTSFDPCLLSRSDCWLKVLGPCTLNDTFPDGCWRHQWSVDSVDLGAMFEQRFPVLQSCPYHVRGMFCQAAQARSGGTISRREEQDRQGEVRGWKLFCMLPVMLLRRDPGGKVTKEELCHRFDLFASGEWATLWQEATAAIRGFTPSVGSAQTDEKRAAAACRRVQMGEVTRARQCLTRGCSCSGKRRHSPGVAIEAPSRKFLSGDIFRGSV